MPGPTRDSLRLRAALVAAGTAAAAAAAAAFLAPVVGPAGAAGAGLALAAAGGAAGWAVLAPAARAAAAAREVSAGRLDPTAFPDGPGEVAAVAAAVRDVGALRAQLAAEYRADLAAVAAALSALGESKAAPAAPDLAAPFPGAADAVRAGYQEAGKELAAARHRAATALGILNGVPDAVVVTDRAGKPRFLNAAAERALRVTSAAAQRKPVAALVADPVPPAPAGDDPDRPLAGGAQVADWVRAGATGTVVVRTPAGGLLELAGGVHRVGAKDAMVCLVGRDLAAARDREADDRAAVRANATRRVVDRYLAESDDALHQVAAQFRLLVGDAKQSGHRDAMLAKLAAAGRGLRQLETFHALAHWFRATTWADLPPVTPSEFQAVEVANLVADRLAGRFKARGNTLKVVDHGGWVFADADRLEAALTGILVHACDATANAQVELRVRRLPAGPDRPAPATEFHVPDAGPALPPDMLGVIDRPFGGLAPAPLGRFDGADGCPLGLVVAARVAAALDGGLAVEPDAGGQLGLRLVVPTRLAGGDPPVTVAAAAPGALDVAPVDEMVNGWRLGAPSA